MTSTLTRILTPFTALSLAFVPLTACGTAPPPAQLICIGPEDPDDLEDLFDRDVVRHEDARCRAGDPLFSLVSVENAPGVGDGLDAVYVSSYRSSHSSHLRSRSTSLIPGVQSRSARRTAAPLPAPRTGAPAATRANTAPSAAKPVPTAAPPRPAPKVETVKPAPAPRPAPAAPKPAPRASTRK